MTKRKSDKRCCQFTKASTNQCTSICESGWDYCLEHLTLLTRINVREVVLAIVSEQMGVDSSSLEDTTLFIEDLDADSLDIPELVMEFEDEFDLSISNEDLSKLSTFGDAHKYISRRLIEKACFLLNANCDISKLIAGVRSSSTAKSRQLTAILKSQLFQDYFYHLAIPEAHLNQLITQTLGCQWIEHVTTVPDWSTKNKLSSVSIILLTQRSFIHLGLTQNQVAAQYFELNDVFLQARYVFNSDGTIESIEVEFLLPPGKRLGKLNNGSFTFREAAGISGAIAFLEKYYLFSKGCS